MSHALRWTPVVTTEALPERNVSITGSEPIHKADEQPSGLSPPMTSQLWAGLKGSSDLLPPRLPKGKRKTIYKSRPWDRTFPLTIASYLEGPHFSYDHTSAFNYITPVTPESYRILLTNVDLASELNIGRNFSFFQSPAPLFLENQEDQWRVVLSPDTSVVLELDFTPGPDYVLAFDALKIPMSNSVKYAGDRRGRQLLSLQVLLMDTLTDMFRPVGEWGDECDQEKVDEKNESPPLVDFQSEHSIIDLHHGKAVVRFKLPCCFLDSMHRTGCYRICINLQLFGHQAQRTLPGTFVVVHTDEKPPEEVAIADEEFPDQSTHNNCCTTRNSGKYHSDRYNVIAGSFERTFSLALKLNRITLWNIPTSENHRRALYSLPLEERKRIKGVIQLEYYHIARMLTDARLDTMVLRREYGIANHLVQLITPIQRLPVELLVLVFSFIPDEQNRKFDTLARTCHRWKEMILYYWAPLKLATWTSLDEVKAMLDRHSGLVSITIDTSSDALDRPIGSLETARYMALMHAALTSIPRWRTLDILSLPDPQQTNSFFEEQSHAIQPLPLKHLRSLNIPIRHDSSRFLDVLLPSIGASSSVHLTEMHLCSVQAISYLALSGCAQVFNHLVSFKCFLLRMDEFIDILPQFWRLEILDVSGLCFQSYPSEVELPLTKTLRQMSLRAVPIDWMNHRHFLRLESCTIISPPTTDTVPIIDLPLCAELHFEGPRIDVIEKVHAPTLRSLTLRSPHWNKSRGNSQLDRLWGATLSEAVFHPITLYLHLTCSSEQLVRALCSMPELKKLELELDRPTALGSRFFIGFLPRSSQITCSYQWAGKSKELLQACPALEELGLKYQRWFRPGESSEMPALVAMAHLNNRDRRVERGIDNQEGIQVDCTNISASTLSSLGLLQRIDGGQPPSWVVEDMIDASSAILNPTGITFHHPETMIHSSPSIYSCLFRWLRGFTVHVDIDQRVLFEALAHFKSLEELHVKRFSPSSSALHLPLLRTLKRLQLGTTSLFWMDGCTFTKLEELKFHRIAEEGRGQFQHVCMPICQSATFPHSISSDWFRAFEMPQLHNLDLHEWPMGLTEGFHYPSTKQFKLHTASFLFVDPVALQDVLESQTELETLEIRGLAFECQLGRGLPDLLGILMKPHTVIRCDGDHGTEPQRQEVPLCPKLKELRLKWQLELEPELERQQGLEKELEWVMKRAQMRELELKQEWELELEPGWKQVLKNEQERVLVQEKGWQRTYERVQELELELKAMGRKCQGAADCEINQCQKFMGQRMEKGCPLRRCQLEWGSCQMEITTSSIAAHYSSIHAQIAQEARPLSTD